MSKLVFDEKLKNEYLTLYNTCIINVDCSSIINKILSNKSRYESIKIVPWEIVAIIHNLECSLRFDRHMHNGDPLTARTINVPSGRPINGTPPFTWEESAIDSLSEKFKGWTDWSIPGMLYKLELYNGTGYRNKGIYTPYLWSGTNHYTKGKYIKDGVYDPNAVSKQLGAACILKKLKEKNNIENDNPHVNSVSANKIQTNVISNILSSWDK